ncbi:glycosyltransferase [Acinetobacter indicus]|uniref:glycosyltransferase n=1 Tax=Acinetobacter indicus TaxID=756892 RepID=UPI0014438DED|nr:glycosyltransferase [Acinetobacter indicus]
MKICYFLTQMHSPGGVERTLHNRLKELSKLYEIYLITIEQGEKPYYFGKISNVKYIDLDIKFDRSNRIFMKKNISNFFRIIIKYFKLMLIINKIKPDYTVSLSLGLTSYLLSFINYKGTRVLEHHASLYHLDFVNKSPNFFKSYILNKHSKHIFLSEEEKKLAHFINTEKIVIPNPIPSDLPPIIPYLKKQNRVIAAGRYVEIKGFYRLLEIWKIIYKSCPHWTLEIYGDPDEKIYPCLKSFIEENDLQDRTFLFSSSKDIVDIINNSKIYAMTSYFENFPMVMLEALSVGTINIAFDCPTGPRNIIDNETGYLVANDDIELYAQTLLKIIENSSEAHFKSNNAIQSSKEYALNKILDKWENILN